MPGWVKLWRKMSDWQWYKDGNTMRLFLHLLLTANFHQSKWFGEIVEEGQVVTTVDNLSRELGMSTQNVRTSLTKLKSTNEITSRSTNKYTVITIANWALYQSGEDDLTNEITTDLTNKQQTTNKQLTNDQQHTKKDKKEEKNKTPRAKPITQATAYTPEFEMFLSYFPNRAQKRLAFVRWNDRLRDGEFEEAMIAAARNYAEACELEKKEPTYWKHPENFIDKNKMYVDYIEGIPEGLLPERKAGIKKWAT